MLKVVGSLLFTMAAIILLQYLSPQRRRSWMKAERK
jgi:hypothetical protein